MQADSLASASPAQNLFDADSLNAALAVVEELVTVSAELNNLIKTRLTGEIQTEALALSTRLESLITLVDENSIPIPTPNKGSLLTPRYKSVIERLGIGGELIRLREQEHKTIAELARLYNLAPNTISRFFQYYESLKPAQQSKVRRASVFDTTERLEDLMQMVLTQIARLQGTNDEVAVRYTDQLRQTIEMAAKLTEKMTNYAAYQQFTKSVVEILINELPERRNEILEKIQILGKTQNLLKPTL